MDEAKTLVHMSISAIFAGMILAAAVGLVSVGYTMWSAFSRQDYANQRMSDYANYTAFDNTTIRGQEAIQLIKMAEEEDFFVLIYTSTTGTEMDNLTVASTCYCYVPENSVALNFDNKKIDTVNSNVTLKNALTRFKNGSTVKSLYTSKPISSTDTSYLTTQFLNKSYFGNPSIDNTYAAFKSVLVYDNDSTTDIAGVILVRESKTTTKY